jgi:hypothetical protein
MSDAATPGSGRSPRMRRRRSATESLLSIALLLEAVLMFFVMLVVYGLKALPPAAAFGGGIGLIVALVVVGRFVGYPWGVWLGWALQVVLVATGILLPVLYFVALVFVGIWVFCFVKGRQLDRLPPAPQPEESA